ncbi:hypothetical protein RUND412_003642 [Rhizina undulata]
MDDPATYVCASPFLQGFINRTLRITTTDKRMFVGELKCTDKDKNLILTKTHEYHSPTENDLLSNAANAGADARGKLKLTLRSRYLGLVVIPGEYIVKVEEEVADVRDSSVVSPRTSPLAL